MQPDAISRIEADIQWLTKTIGPRPAFSSEARLAALGIRDRIQEAGWTPQFVHLANNLVACSGTGATVLLAHSDTVTKSPGTLDNAVGVATLIEIARQHPTADLCVGFPAQEEIGLIGSTHLAEQIEAWHPNPSAIQLVVSLDLVGHGKLSVTGLNRQWQHDDIEILLHQTNLYSEYGYQVVSRLFPNLERSDHAPFAHLGYRSMQLLGRDEYGLTPNYHLPTDTSYDIDAIIELEHTLNTLINLEWNPRPSMSTWSHTGTLGHQLLPWWLIVGVLLSALLVALSTIRLHTQPFRQESRSVLLAIPYSVLAGLLASLPAIVHVLPSSEQEMLATHLYGLPSSGWWLGALSFLPLSLLLLGYGHYRQWFKGNATGWMGLCSGILWWIDPVLAFPWALATLLSRIRPWLGVVPIAYWLQPNILRELSTHGLVPPMLWCGLTLLCWPLWLSRPKTDSVS